MSINLIKEYKNLIDFNTEGFISQLLDSRGKKKFNSISPHIFSYRIVKDAGVVPVVTTDFNASNAFFYGTVTLTIKSNGGLADTYLAIGSTIVVTCPTAVGAYQFQNVAFDSLLRYHNLASIDASVYNLTLSFVGYKVNTN